MGAPVQTAKQKLKSATDHAILISTLKKFHKMAQIGEAERRANDKKGIKFARSVMWEDGITAGRLPITSNISAALVDEFLDRVTKQRPVFELSPIAGQNESGARLLEGALLTDWRVNRMQTLARSGGQLAAFTRPVLWYTYWDTDARGGLGGNATRIIPGHRCRIDNRSIFVRDMENVGFSEIMSRAKAMELFPDNTAEIESAIPYSGSSTSDKPGMMDDPLKTANRGGQPGQLSRLVADNQGQFTGKTTVKVGGRKTVDPYAEDIEVAFDWFIDHTPVTRERPKLNSHGKPLYRHVRDERGNLNFRRTGWRVVQGRMGPRYLPNLEPHKEPVMETVVEKLYPHRRHVAWIPNDNVILWDVNWRDPIPLSTQRLTVPIYEYWDVGPAQRLTSLAVARNILWTIIFQRLKLSLAGTWLATPASGLRRNKLTPEDGQIFYAKRIDQDNIRQFPVTPLDVAYVNVLHEIEQEMAKLIGVTPAMQGKQAGRVDTGQAYDTLIEQGGTRVVGAAQLFEETIRDWALIAMANYKRYGTHEHFVEVEEDDGETSWRAASALAVKGEYGLDVDVVSDLIHSEQARKESIKEGAALGLYPIPLMAKLARFPQWRRGLRMRAEIMADPTKTWMLGIAGAPPGQAGQMPKTPQAPKRSHHKTGAAA